MINPRRTVPIAILGSVLVNGVLGLAYCLVLLFSLGDLDALLASPTGFPFMQLFENTTKSVAGGTILSLVVSLLAVAANAAGLTSASRTAWAFARDRAIPFDRYFAHVNKEQQIPVRMVVLISILEALLGLLYLGSTTAFKECMPPICFQSSSCWCSGTENILAFLAVYSVWAMLADISLTLRHASG